MLLVGRGLQHTCQGPTRRAFLQAGASTVLGLALADRLRAAPAGSAKSVIRGKLHQGKKMIAGEGGGSLGAAADPFRLEYDPAHGTRVPALQLPADLPPERLADRRRLHAALADAARAAERAGGALDAYRA